MTTTQDFHDEVEIDWELLTLCVGWNNWCQPVEQRLLITIWKAFHIPYCSQRAELTRTRADEERVERRFKVPSRLAEQNERPTTRHTVVKVLSILAYIYRYWPWLKYWCITRKPGRPIIHSYINIIGCVTFDFVCHIMTFADCYRHLACVAGLIFQRYIWIVHLRSNCNSQFYTI